MPTGHSNCNCSISAFPVGDPAQGIGGLGLLALEPRTLAPSQVRSLKNICDRLERFQQKKGAAGPGRAPPR